jgi:4-diphosphocytidyl-2-C-methyl-D-erythritol kinase
MIVFPNAKINIGLFVLNKRPDGFHNLESIFYPINWVDILEIVPSKTFQFTTSGLNIDGEITNNLVVKAYRLIKENHDIPACHIHLHKQIPMGAGLGGGSADAAFTLTLLNRLFGLNIERTLLLKYADQLGSDCPFFIENTPKFVKGKGEVLEDVGLNLKGYYIKLIYPNIHISTKQAFNGLNINSTNRPCLKNSTVSDLLTSPTKITNDFESTVFHQFPELKKIKQQLLNEGAFYASMTGTGSTLYGLFKNEPHINEHKNGIVKVIAL